jgi:hypothetical protein
MGKGGNVLFGDTIEGQIAQEGGESGPFGIINLKSGQFLMSQVRDTEVMMGPFLESGFL